MHWICVPIMGSTSSTATGFLESNHTYANGDGEEGFLHVQRRCLCHLSDINARYRQEILPINKQQSLQLDSVVINCW
jgi:hypothetical protein